MKRDDNGDLYDRDGKWSTSTCIICMFLGFTMGFMACHELYAGIDRNNLTNLQKVQYTP